VRREGIESLFLTNLLTKEFRPALQNNGGQALHLLATAVKTDSNKPKSKKYWHRSFYA